MEKCKYVTLISSKHQAQVVYTLRREETVETHKDRRRRT